MDNPRHQRILRAGTWFWAGDGAVFAGLAGWVNEPFTSAVCWVNAILALIAVAVGLFAIAVTRDG